ncbi:Aste57867_14204 [Aphanomyces stellatus]|uniref:Aste57867_14204 protein n=1 Tax=Aphanomyces stellatus TaxID=120398 RepID=A0A485L0E4_9STRA|nr:hypothetical protein As57867_014153 [Aphanomyces stellatus]VFT91029.1 Aste57867_14204 [Aphanomyces stellatus]
MGLEYSAPPNESQITVSQIGITDPFGQSLPFELRAEYLRLSESDSDAPMENKTMGTETHTSLVTPHLLPSVLTSSPTQDDLMGDEEPRPLQDLHLAPTQLVFANANSEMNLMATLEFSAEPHSASNRLTVSDLSLISAQFQPLLEISRALKLSRVSTLDGQPSTSLTTD